jgi:hypothetical protein
MYNWVWKIDMFTAEFEMIGSMCDARDTDFAVCNIGHLIYVIGGSGYTNGNCERLDVLSRKWSRLPGELKHEYVCEMAVATLKKRYIYTFGGRKASNSNAPEGRSQKSVFTRLDTLRMDRGWEVLPLYSHYWSRNPCYYGYGVMPLGPISDDEFEFLVFGGGKTGQSNEQYEAVFTTSIRTPFSYSWTEVKNSHMRPAAFDSESFSLPSSTITP